MSVRWNDMRSSERRIRPRPESPGRRASDPLLDREPDEDARNPWSADKRALIRAIRAQKEKAA